MNSSTEPSLLAMRGIWKRFGGVPVLRDVSFELKEGEVHALVGENGAGKSTLMHILAGVHQTDEGEITLCGSRVVLRNEHVAQEHGIAIVFQERSLFSTLSLAENIFAARQPVNRFGKVDRRRLFADARVLLKQVGIEAEPATALHDLSPAQQQMVEIAKALSLGARIVIFDEPTAALTDTETRALFGLIGQLQRQGVGIIYISHRLEEIFKIADRVTVLKDGAGQGTVAISATSAADLVRRMVGRELTGQRIAGENSNPPGRVRLEVRGLADHSLAREVRTVLKDISFAARAGEILALAGLAGAGRTELALSIFGARPRESGEILIDGERVEINSPAEAVRAGIGYLAEDRKEAGLFMEMGIAHNIAAGSLQKFGSWWFKDRAQEATAENYRQKLRIACRHVKQPVQTLSGGNQQKVVLAKWLLVNPKVLIVDEPTRGVDVGAKAEVHALLHELSRRGTAVVVISSDLPEVLALADRIIVMREGKITGELNGSEATEEETMRLATIDLPR